MNERKPIVEKIYDALKYRAGEREEIPMLEAEHAAAAATNMPVNLVREWMRTMHVLGIIGVDGVRVRLVRDYGYRTKPMEHFEEIREGQKVGKIRKETRKMLKELAQAKPAKE
jgi:hypothetical protein